MFIKCLVAPDVSNWNWSFGQLDAIIGAKVNSIIKQSFDETPPVCELPFLYNGVGNPLAINLNMPLGPDEGDGAVWQYSVQELVEDALGAHRRIDTEQVSLEGAEIGASISASLRELADWIDTQVIQPNVKASICVCGQAL